MTVQDAVENSMFIREMLSEMLSGERDHKLQIEHITDNISLKNSIYSNRQVNDKRLRIDLAALKQEINNKDVIVHWVPGHLMLADALSKKGVNKEHLNTVLRTGRISLAT